MLACTHGWTNSRVAVILGAVLLLWRPCTCMTVLRMSNSIWNEWKLIQQHYFVYQILRDVHDDIIPSATTERNNKTFRLFIAKCLLDHSPLTLNHSITYKQSIISSVNILNIFSSKPVKIDKKAIYCPGISATAFIVVVLPQRREHFIHIQININIDWVSNYFSRKNNK